MKILSITLNFDEARLKDYFRGNNILEFIKNVLPQYDLTFEINTPKQGNTEFVVISKVILSTEQKQEIIDKLKLIGVRFCDYRNYCYNI